MEIQPGKEVQLRILIAEEYSGRSVAVDLERCGYEVVRTCAGIEVLDLHRHVDVVLLDLELPDIDGVELCRRIREISDVPVIAFAEGEIDRVLGLQAGSDDCVPRSWSARELMARIDAVVRRVRRPRRLALSHDALHIDVATRRVFVDDEQVSLTRKEFDLLYRLASNPGVVVSRVRLMADIWGTAQVPHPRACRTIDTHVSSLRGKLGDGRWIRTVRGVGFRFEYC